MKVEYRILQYFPDPIRAEARNVAVLSFKGHEASFRAVGQRSSGLVDVAYFEPIAKERRHDAWVWAEWNEWLNALVATQCADHIRSVMDRLQTRNAQFAGHVGGFLEVDPAASTWSIADQLFRELVGDPRLGPSDHFMRSVDTFLDASRLSARPDFQRDVEVEFDIPGKSSPMIVDFVALLAAEPRIGIKCIQFRHHATAAATAQVNDARFTFEQVADIGFIGKDRSIVLHDTPSKGRGPLLDRLKGVAGIFNLDDVDSPMRLRKTLGI